ncbi:MAG: PcfJ domain-containing protein [Clostridia bacterium]|jgi:hypothetical protein|nr:PcfJ domain-containing protein [Clostridia bacterium]DAN82477.1 MAG TPA: PcfJ like protein [Caudoviricetes sp.]
MGYINKRTRNIIEKMKTQFILPKDWNEFIYEKEKKHNLILKTKNIYFCTNCQQSFTFLNKGPKVKTQHTCPHCHNTYWIRSGTLKNWKKRDNILLLDKIDGELIIRIFEMETIYNAEKQEMEHDTVEYARKIVDDDYREIRNERVSIAQYGPFVYHWKDNEGEWRTYDGNWYESMPHGYLYIDNLKKVLKDTIYEKSRLWEYAKKYKNDNIDLRGLLSVAKYESFETLVEMKLYRLAEDARQFICKGSFKKIFGVDKTFYNFMKKNNISYGELKLLQKYPTRDIRRLRFLDKYEYVIDDIKEYTTIDNFINYFRRKRLNDGHLYRDYLKFAKDLGLDLKNKRYLFPDKLKTMHDKYEKQVQIMKQELLAKKIVERVALLSKNTFKNKEFIIFPATSVNDLIDESKQQNNCVRTYAEKYAEGDCDIYFMRKVNTPKISLVTVEVKNDRIVQKRTKNNANTNKKQDKFLDEWQKKLLEKVAV